MRINVCGWLALYPQLISFVVTASIPDSFSCFFLPYFCLFIFMFLFLQYALALEVLFQFFYSVETPVAVDVKRKNSSYALPVRSSVETKSGHQLPFPQGILVDRLGIILYVCWLEAESSM